MGGLSASPPDTSGPLRWALPACTRPHASPVGARSRGRRCGRQHGLGCTDGGAAGRTRAGGGARHSPLSDAAALWCRRHHDAAGVSALARNLGARSDAMAQRAPLRPLARSADRPRSTAAWRCFPFLAALAVGWRSARSSARWSRARHYLVESPLRGCLRAADRVPNARAVVQWVTAEDFVPVRP